MHLQMVSEYYFKNDNSDYAKALRAQFGEDGYQKYSEKINSIMTNPLEESNKVYSQQKEAEYKQAIANRATAENVFNNNYKNKYMSNLEGLKSNNAGISLTGTQKTQALQAAGSGAEVAYRNLEDAKKAEDLALSLWNDSTHNGINFLS